MHSPINVRPHAPLVVCFLALERPGNELVAATRSDLMPLHFVFMTCLWDTSGPKTKNPAERRGRRLGTAATSSVDALSS